MRSKPPPSKMEAPALNHIPPIGPYSFEVYFCKYSGNKQPTAPSMAQRAGAVDCLAALDASFGIFGPFFSRKTAKLVRRPPKM